MPAPKRSSRSPVLPVAAASLVALALWVSGGLLAVTDAGPGGSRVGLLPPWWLLVLLAAITLAAAWRWRSAGRRWLPALVAVLVLLPWLPGPVPSAFLIWTGPMAELAWIVAAIAGVAAAAPPRVFADRRWATDAARAPIAAALIAFVLYAAAAWRLSPNLPGGDEPHYLVITQSLLYDGDLRIENNHRRGDYLPYFPGALKPDYLRRGVDREIYSIHAPGLSVLVLPAFAAFGYPGVVLFLALFAAVGSALAWKAAHAVSGEASAAWFGWAALALGTPFFFHAFTIYPDGPAAVLVMTGVLALASDAPARAKSGSVRWLLHGAALAALPWLHTRNVIAACSLGLVIGLRLVHGPGRARRLLAFLAVPMASAIAWFGYFYAIYGTFNPGAPYGHYTQTELRFARVGLPGLLIDQQFGAVPYAPVLALAVIGWIALARVRPRLALELVAVLLPSLVAAGSYFMWWGGRSAPARFAVPVLLPLALPLAVWWSRARTRPRATRAVGLVLLLITLIVTGMMVWVERGRLVFNNRDGFALWLEWLGPLANLPRGLPSLLRDVPSVALRDASIWIAAIVAAWLVVRVVERRVSADPRALALAAPSAIAAAIMVALSLVWMAARAQPLAPMAAQLDLVDAFDPRLRPLGIRYAPLGLGPATLALESLEVSQDRRRPIPEAPLLLLPRLPPGRYALRIFGRGSGATVTATVGRSERPLRSWRLDEAMAGEKTLDLDLDVGVGALVVRAAAGEGSSGAAIRDATLRPLAIVPPRRRLVADYARRSAEYGSRTVLFLDDSAYAESSGFWVAGGPSRSRIVIVPGGRGLPLTLLVRNGPIANRIGIQSGEWRDERDFAPNEEWTVEVPPASPIGFVVAFEVQRGFRPAEVDLTSRDFRRLGCWVEVAPP